MFRKMSLALLAERVLPWLGSIQAAAIEAAPLAEPTVIYADQPAQPRAGAHRLCRTLQHGRRLHRIPVRRRRRRAGAISSSRSISSSRLTAAASHAAADGSAAVDAPAGGGRSIRRSAAFDPKYEKQLVEYHGKEGAGTIVVDTPNKFLFLVQGDGKALRYGIGVGRPGFTWSGVKTISAKKEWPAWTPPPEMLARRPDLPRHMEGGPENPLGARAMYLGSSLYRIHGSNEPWTIGTNVSSGCIRMRNEDVIDLYGRVNVGARVVVI